MKMKIKYMKKFKKWIKKKKLIKKLEDIKNQLEDKDKETIRDVYLSYSEEQIFENKEVKRDKIDIKVKIFYKALLFLITSFYLIETFLIISLKNSFWNLFISSIKCRFDKWCDKEEFLKRTKFFEYFREQLLKEPIDLNIIMLWNFIGIKLSNSIGLRLSSVLILFVNSLILLLTYNINYNEYVPETCKYSYLKIVLLFFNWLFMSIGFGASSLLSQQKFIDFYSIFDEDDNIKNNNRIPYQKIELNENSNDLIIKEDLDAYDKNQAYSVKNKIEEQKNKIRKKKL